MWIDSMGTMMMRFEGSCSEDHKTTTMMAKFNMPGAGPMTMKTVITVQDENSHTMEGWVGPSEAQMMKSMEITYTRQ